MEIEVTATRFNVTALIGWASLCVGVVTSALQCFFPTPVGFVFLAIEIVGGAITITFAGPLKTVTKRRAKVRLPT